LRVAHLGRADPCGAFWRGSGGPRGPSVQSASLGMRWPYLLLRMTSPAGRSPTTAHTRTFIQRARHFAPCTPQRHRLTRLTFTPRLAHYTVHAPSHYPHTPHTRTLPHHTPTPYPTTPHVPTTHHHHTPTPGPCLPPPHLPPPLRTTTPPTTTTRFYCWHRRAFS